MFLARDRTVRILRVLLIPCDFCRHTAQICSGQHKNHHRAIIARVFCSKMVVYNDTLVVFFNYFFLVLLPQFPFPRPYKMTNHTMCTYLHTYITVPIKLMADEGLANNIRKYTRLYVTIILSRTRILLRLFC